MSNQTAAARVPTRLRRLALQWEANGRDAQTAPRWNRLTWQATLPECSGFLSDLPETLGRASVGEYGRRAAASTELAVEAFVATMVWGYGTRGYGAYRTAKILHENRNAPAVLCEAAQRVARDGGGDAFAWLARHRLRHLGVAFATKYLFFCSGPHAPPALVLDRLVQTWLRRHAGCRISLDWRERDYRHYLDLVTEWATALGIAPADAEYLMFSDAASAEPGSPWARSSPTTARADHDEQATVLDALDEAATAFAALPFGPDAPELDQFEQRIHELQRLVLAHRSASPADSEASVSEPWMKNVRDC